MGNGTLILIILVVVIIAVGSGVALMKQAQKKRSEHLKEKFGPEYDRAVARSDDQRSAESELAEREKRHDRLELRELDSGQRQHYEQRWEEVQRDFVDDPGTAVRQADRLITEVMEVRGYPVDDFDERAETLSVDYPTVTAEYRKARKISQANDAGRATTEDLRTAVTCYRSLVDSLLHDDDKGSAGAGGDRHAATSSSNSHDGDHRDHRDHDRHDVDGRDAHSREHADVRTNSQAHDSGSGDPERHETGHTASGRADRAADSNRQEGGA